MNANYHFMVEDTLRINVFALCGQPTKYVDTMIGRRDLSVFV